MAAHFSVDNERVTISVSENMCLVTVKQAMAKDNGPWHFVVGCGNNVADLVKESFTYKVAVKGILQIEYL